MLFFSASPGVQDEFIVIQISNTRLWFLFDPQGSFAFLFHFAYLLYAAKLRVKVANKGQIPLRYPARESARELVRELVCGLLGSC